MLTAVAILRDDERMPDYGATMPFNPTLVN